MMYFKILDPMFSHSENIETTFKILKIQNNMFSDLLRDMALRHWAGEPVAESVGSNPKRSHIF